MNGLTAAVLLVAMLQAPRLAGTPASERVTLGAGAHVRAEPAPGALSLAVIDADMELPVRERRGDWVLVSYGGYDGWVLPGGEDAPDTRKPAPRGADSERLARARELLGIGAEGRPLGTYRLYTDVADEALLASLAKIADSVAATYRERYGLDPGPSGGEAVVVFRGGKEYRAFEDARIKGLGSDGNAGRGIAAILVALDPEETRALLVHELTHLLNRRALGEDVPPWLEEGMAEDLAYCRVDASGRVLIGTTRGRTTVTVEGQLTPVRRVLTEVSGPQAIVSNVAKQAGGGHAPSLVELTGLPWRAFVASDARERTYPASALFVRYLLDGEKGSRAAAFRAFLADVASGAPPTEAVLLSRLETDWESLQRGFQSWVALRRLPES